MSLSMYRMNVKCYAYYKLNHMTTICKMVKDGGRNDEKSRCVEMLVDKWSDFF